MARSHVVPLDDVVLDGFIKIDHSPFSDIYLALSEITLECKPSEILGLKLGFWMDYSSYGVSYTTRRIMDIPRPWLFTAESTMLEILHQLIKELPDGTTLYLFGYQHEAVRLPRKCPKPPIFEGGYPKLITVIVKT